MSNTFRNQNFAYVNSVKWTKHIKNVDHKHHILKMSDGVVGREFLIKMFCMILYMESIHMKSKKWFQELNVLVQKNTLTCVMMNTKKIDIIFNK